MIGDEPLKAFARGMHQDVMVGLTGRADLARLLVSQLRPDEREAFRAWLVKALATLHPTEMNGMLNRANSDLVLSSGAAHGLLRDAARELGIDQTS